MSLQSLQLEGEREFEYEEDEDGGDSEYDEDDDDDPGDSEYVGDDDDGTVLQFRLKISEASDSRKQIFPASKLLIDSPAPTNGAIRG